MKSETAIGLTAAALARESRTATTTTDIMVVAVVAEVVRWQVKPEYRFLCSR